MPPTLHFSPAVTAAHSPEVCGLVLWGIWRYSPKRLELVLVGDRRPPGLIVHRSATLVRRDITIVQGLRVTSPARTMLDNAARLNAKQLARAINLPGAAAQA